MSNDTDAKIEQLEVKLAFQEHTIETLNLALADQQQRIELMERHIEQLVVRVKQLLPDAIASEAEETPPPHY